MNTNTTKESFKKQQILSKKKWQYHRKDPREKSQAVDTSLTGTKKEES